MPERGRHYRIHIENAGEVAKRVASGIGDTVAERLDHLREHHHNSKVVRNVAIGVGAGAAAVVGGREVLRRIKKHRAAKPGKDKVGGSNSDIKPDSVPTPGKEAEADTDIYGVKLPTILSEVMSWIDDKDDVRGSKKDVPRYVVDFLGDVPGADVNNVEESLKEAIRKKDRLFGAYFREVNGRVVEDVKRRGFEVDPNLDSPLGDFENYSPNHSKQSLIRELGYQADQTPAEFAENMKSEIDCLEMSYIRQSALPALEKFRIARGMSTFAEIAEMQPVDLLRKDLVKLNLVSAEEAEAYKNNKQSVPEEEPTIDEYDKRVKDLMDAAKKLEEDPKQIKSFDELRGFEDKVLAVRIDSADCLDEVYTSLRSGGEFISDDLIRRERERTNPPIPVPTPTLRPTQEDDPRRQGNRCSTTKKLALAFAAGAALVGAGWISHELTEDNGGNTTSLSYNIDLSHNSLNAFPGSNVDHVVQGNNYLGNNGGESRSGNTNGGAKQGTEQAPSNGSGQDGTSNGNGAEDGKQRSGSLTPAEAKDYIGGLDGNKDGKLKVVISKADGSDGIDTVDWALARDAKTGLFHAGNPSIDGAARWGITSAAIADQGKSAEDYHWVNNGDVFEFKVGDQMVRAFIKADVPLVKAAQEAPQAPSQSATPDSGASKGAQTPEPSKTPTNTPTAIATGTETQTPTMVPTRTPAVDVVTNTPTPSVTATATITSTATGTPVNQEHSFSAYSLKGKGHTPVTICHATGSDKNPYVEITVDDDAVDGNGNNSADHNRDGHQDGEDIIPPGTWDADGRNWDSHGQAIYNNDCHEVQPTATVTSTATSTEVPTNTATATEVPPTVTMTPTPTSTPTEVPPTVTRTVTAISTKIPSTATATEVPPVIVIKSATPTSTEVPASPSPTSTATAPIEVPASPTVVVKAGPRTGFGGNKNEDPAWMAFAAAALGTIGAATLYKGMKFGRLSLFSDDEDESILARRIITDRKEKREKEGENK